MDRRRSTKLRLVVLFSVLIAALTPASATHYPLKATHWKAQCKLVKELRKSTAAASSKMVSKAGKWEQLEKAKLKAVLHAFAHIDKDNSTVPLILATCAAKMQAQLVAGLKVDWPKAANAIAHTNDLAGAINSAILSISTAATSNSGFCLDSDTPGSDGKAGLESAGCNELPANATRLDQTPDSTAIDASGFKAVTGATAGDMKEARTTSKCGVFETAANPTSSAGINFGASNTYGLAYGLIKLTTPRSPTAEDLGALTGNVVGKAKTLAKHAHSAYLQLQAIEGEQQTGNLLRIYESIAGSSFIDTCIADVLAEQQPETDRATIKSELKRTKATYFGQNNDKITEITAKIEETQVLGTQRKAVDKRKLSQVTEISELQQALTFYTQIIGSTLASKNSLIEKLNEAAKTKDVKSAADACSKIKDKSDCDKKSFCTYNESAEEADKKCEFNEEKAKANHVPVTQSQTAGTTTASDRCTRHKDKANCEKENEGQKHGEKANCGWIEDKGKDYSFFINKKLALTTAAFMVLFLFDFSPSTFPC
uniref:Variant surface glycoprotein 790 n=1 Tax=Trypanosoma brucei TaxID=5691 RepID=M4SYQ7_9TRYP|nr:variant surface glycoprotein 790 [Trypanosoma brucei]